MKSIVKLLVVSAFLTLMFAMPVMAKPVTSISAENTDVLLQKLQANATKTYNGYQEFVKVQCGPTAAAYSACATASSRANAPFPF